MAGTRDENAFMAGLAEQALCFDDMAQYMKKVAESSDQLTETERNMLSVSYKNAVAQRRGAIRELSQMNEAGIVAYRGRIQEELQAYCTEIITLVQKLAKAAADAETQVFYMKMEGDYFRYLAEAGGANDQYKQSAAQAYQNARTAGQALPAGNPVVLGLALNLSVFYYEVLKEHAQARNLAQEAVQTAKGQVSPDSEAGQVLQLLEDNLALWSHHAGEVPADGTAVEDF